MMEQFIKTKGTGFIILITAFQLLTGSCSRYVYPLQEFNNIENRSERRILKDFFDSEVEMTLDTRTASPREIIQVARKYLGAPHCMGGRTMQCMDCSGLVATVFAAFEIDLPHNSEEQARYGKILPDMDQLSAGDMVFFVRSYNTTNFITHSGIYIGNYEFIHASTSRGVTITSLNNPWWNERFIFGTRVFEYL